MGVAFVSAGRVWTRGAALPTLVLGATALLAGLTGCGAKAVPTADPRPPPAHAAPRAAAPAPGTGTAIADMVSAVPAGKASNAFSFKFDLRTRPSAAQPVDIDVALTPGVEFDRVQVMFHGNDGLEVRSGAAMPPVERPEVGVPLHHTLSVVPKGPGIYSVSAVVQSESSEGSISRTYAIPVIAGEGLAAPSAEAVAPSAADGAHPPS